MNSFVVTQCLLSFFLFFCLSRVLCFCFLSCSAVNHSLSHSVCSVVSRHVCDSIVACRVWLGELLFPRLAISHNVGAVRTHTSAHLRQKTGESTRLVCCFLVAASCFGNLRTSPQKSHQHFRDEGFFPICPFSLSHTSTHKLQAWIHLTLLPRCWQQRRLYTIYTPHTCARGFT